MPAFQLYNPSWQNLSCNVILFTLSFLESNLCCAVGSCSSMKWDGWLVMIVVVGCNTGQRRPCYGVQLDWGCSRIFVWESIHTLKIWCLSRKRKRGKLDSIHSWNALTGKFMHYHKLMSADSDSCFNTGISNQGQIMALQDLKDYIFSKKWMMRRNWLPRSWKMHIQRQSQMFFKTYGDASTSLFPKWDLLSRWGYLVDNAVVILVYHLIPFLSSLFGFYCRWNKA